MSLGFLISICLISSLVIWQDFSDRSIAVWVLILFSLILLADALYEGSMWNVLRITGYNMLFLSLETLVLFVYYFVRYRGTKRLFGSVGGADVWLLLALCVSFSTVNYIFFLTLSMIFSLVAYLAYRMIYPGANRQIPLAGLVVMFYCASRIILFSCFTSDWRNDELIGALMGI